ncbi:MAG TPA: pilus assembly protein N-terminal domain-containing protein [Bryobacteraceae bacterium]|nr:pilus assembly protein N-terminal domain-containing protein [Bryobacteraceae bacterium]
MALAIAATGALPGAQDNRATRLTVAVGKAVVIDSPVEIRRVSVASSETVEAVAISPRELLINAKAPGETSLILWENGGRRVVYDITVLQSTSRVDAVRQQLKREMPDQNITLQVEGQVVFLHGTATDLFQAERAVAIASTLGKVVNLLRVTVPPVEAQILLKVRFANVDRSASRELGVNLLSTGALNTIGSVNTNQFTPPRLEDVSGDMKLSVSDALNIFLFRRDLNLAATIRALQARRLLEMLAEPNVLAINGKAASFVSGGEFPFPTLQGGGAGLGAVTIQFREFGVRINFLPNVTPRGTIRLQVTPEVSSLDFANGLSIQGYHIPALATRRVQTEVELESGQSFVIAGLMDNRTTENLSKIPGLGDIPLLGKLFQSQQVSKNNTELLVLITPELVRPIPAGQQTPTIGFPVPFLDDAPKDVPRTPSIEKTGPVPVTPVRDSVPMEQLINSKRQEQPAPATGTPAMEFVPVPVTPRAPDTAAPSQPQGGTSGK